MRWPSSHRQDVCGPVPAARHCDAGPSFLFSRKVKDQGHGMGKSSSQVRHLFSDPRSHRSDSVGTNVHFSESEESECHSVVSDSATPWTAAPPPPPGSSVHGILQARIPEWVVIAFSKGSYRARDQTGSPELQVDSLPS
ncbi:hypothetical protein MG293_000467 [Ovis ammon polii]|uniref:Uncharacterized protein n=1 Tax=Ovis ammon polii TaxID=230172 RepID=A0AAD4UNU5_OVIAM|nr:hypothetical protein MG293_000467 [Ovis ammon polii]